VVEVVTGELRRALRRLLRSPIITCLAIVSLGASAGSALVVGSAYEALYGEPPYVRDLYKLGYRDHDSAFSSSALAIIERTADTAGVAAMATESSQVVVDRRTEFRSIAFVNRQFFSACGISAQQGKLDLSHQDPTAVVSDEFWRTAYGGRTSLADSWLTLGDVAVRIVGVLPKGFRGLDPGNRIDVYVVLELEEPIKRGSSARSKINAPWLSIYVRTEPGQGRRDAEARLRAVEQSLAEINAPPGLGGASARALALRPFPEWRSRARLLLGDPLSTLTAMVLLALGIAFANNATLQILRASDRSGELNIMRALGASPYRVALSLSVEAVVIGALSGLVAMAFAFGVGPMANALLESPLDRGIRPDISVRFNWGLLAQAAVVAVSGIVLAMAGALWAGRRGDGRAVASHHPSHRLLWPLATLQVGVVVAVLAYATVEARALYRVTQEPIGADTGRVLLGTLGGPVWARTPDETIARIDQLVTTLKTRNRVSSAAIGVTTPLSDGIMMSRLSNGHVAVNQVTTDFLKVFGTPVLRGRDFDETDTRGAPAVAIVNTHFIARYLGAGEPLGAVFRLNDRAVTVVGVTGPGKYKNAREPERPFVYLPLAQWIGATPHQLRIAVKSTTEDPYAISDDVRGALVAVHPGIVVQLRAFAEEVYVGSNRERLLAGVGAGMALLSILLAIGALFATFMFAAQRRRLEMGLRLALGAPSWALMRVVIVPAVFVCTLGAMLGVGMALASNRVVQSLVPESTPVSAGALAAGVAVAFVVTALSSVGPLRHALSVDPAQVIRLLDHVSGKR
jgi:predicted permease